MQKTRKDQRPAAELPKGFIDVAAEDLQATGRMLETIRRVYHSYGFEPLDTPALEYTEALGKFLPDQDRPNAGVFSFQDEDEKWMSLRYDLTAPLARYVAANFDKLPQAVPPLCGGAGVAQREAGAGAISAVHAVRCGYGGDGQRRGGCGDLHAGGGHDGGAGHSAWAVCDQGE